MSNDIHADNHSALLLSLIVLVIVAVPIPTSPEPENLTELLAPNGLPVEVPTDAAFPHIYV